MIKQFLPLAILFVLAVGVNETFAQRRLPAYNSRPSISPYVNLFNNNNGGINNYFQFVRPLQQQSRINQQQFNQTARLQRQLNQPQVNTQIGPGAQPINGMLRPGSQGVGMPAQAASFFNYSHFYAVPRSQSGGGNRRVLQY